MAGLEVEDLARAAVVAETRAEDEAVLEPAAEDQLVGLGHVEGLAVQLLKEVEVVGNARGDGVSGEEIPHDLVLVAAPGEVAVGAHHLLEDLGVVTRVEDDETHLAHVDTLADALHQTVVHLMVRHVTPPEQYVGLVQHLIGQTLVGVVQRGEADVQRGIVSLQKGLDQTVDAVGVDVAAGLLQLFPEPDILVVPMQQHIGAPCQPLVKVGDVVTMGQKIGDNPAPLCAPIHATVSGKVVAIEPRRHCVVGALVPSIVIENDGNASGHISVNLNNITSYIATVNEQNEDVYDLSEDLSKRYNTENNLNDIQNDILRKEVFSD